MYQQIEEVLSAQNYDLVIASEWAMAVYGQNIRNHPALLEDVELGVIYEQFANTTSLWPRLRYGLTWTKHRRHLAQTLPCFRACTVVSEQDRKLLSRVAPTRTPIHIIPNCIQLADYQTYEDARPNTLIFTGPFQYHANYDAMVWFLREVYPHIQAQIPDVHLSITGKHTNLPLPSAHNVTLTGFVDQIQPLIARAWISLAPIRIGGGTRLKILEAMALGTPVVATSKGAEGLNVENDVHLLIADTAEAFAEAVIRLLQNPGLRQRLAANARQIVREMYDWDTVMPRFLSLVEHIAHS
jgi:glycosyltransferase involved in cell wall biosynthesis